MSINRLICGLILYIPSQQLRTVDRDMNVNCHWRRRGHLLIYSFDSLFGNIEAGKVGLGILKERMQWASDGTLDKMSILTLEIKHNKKEF